jgi:hypothetical protein
MADPPAKKKKSGLAPRTSVLIVGGSLAAYLGWRYIQNRNAAAAGTATTGGTTIPDAGGGTGGTGGSAPNAPASLAEWIQQALSGANYTSGYTNTSLYNDIQSWLNGNCVSATGFNVIGGLITTMGLPPGYATAPALSACASTPPPGPPPKPPPGTAAQRSAYDQALAAFRAAQSHHATSSVLQQLYEEVLGTQSQYQGTAGSASSRSAYDQALANYRRAVAAHASPQVLQVLMLQVLDTQTIYAGKPA